MNKKNIFFVVMCLVFGIVLLLHCFYINSRYPDYNITIYNADMAFEFNNLNITVEEIKIYNPKEFLEEYPMCQCSEDKQFNIVIPILVENTTNMTQIISLDQFILESDGWASYIAINNFYNLNVNIDTYRIEVPAGQKLEITVPYTYYFDITEDRLTQGDFMKNDFKLNICMMYPKKVVVDL